MRVWGKKPEQRAGALSVAQAAVAGASRDELLRVALATLVREGKVDRIGVWLEADSNPGRPDKASKCPFWEHTLDCCLCNRKIKNQQTG